jgi:hypothetical protein
MVCYAEPVFVNHGELWWASGCESWCFMLSQWLWTMVNYTEPLVVNHGVLWWASGCESWWVMLSQWLWNMVCSAEPVGVNHGVLCWASGWIMGCYAEPVVMYHGVLCWASRCESWCVILIQWLWIMVCTMFHNHLLIMTHHDSQPLAQHNTAWFTTTGSA